jgi:hypothetical protein
MKDIGIGICLLLIIVNTIGLITFKKIQFKEKTCKIVGGMFFVLDLMIALALAKFA